MGHANRLLTSQFAVSFAVLGAYRAWSGVWDPPRSLPLPAGFASHRSLRRVGELVRVQEWGEVVPGEVLMTLAQFAGQTVAAAAVTDVWEAARGRVARLLGPWRRSSD
jgi:hypothetical protein